MVADRSQSHFASNNKSDGDVGFLRKRQKAKASFHRHKAIIGNEIGD